MENQNIIMTRGDTLSFGVEVTDIDGNPMTFDTAYMTCKKSCTDLIPVFQKSLEDGISQVGDDYVVRVAPEDTEHVEAGRYYYDLQVGVGQDIFTILRGVIDLLQDVTF
jgi:hypothetical protein